MKRTILYLFILVITALFCFPVHSQNKKNEIKVKTSDNFRLRLDQPISAKFPDMTAFVSVIDKQNSPVLSLTKENFSLFIDGKEVSNSDIDVQGFQFTKEATDYILLLSANGMMEGQPFDQQMKAATILIDSLREQDTISVYLFAEEVQPVFEFEKNNESLIDKLSKVKFMGGNPHLYDAIVYSVRRIEQSPNRRKVLFVISDGRESGSRYSEEQLYSTVDEINVPIYSIGLQLMSGSNLSPAAKLSDRSGGTYIMTSDIEATSKHLKTLINIVKMGYIIDLESKNLEPDNRFHQLLVKAHKDGFESSFTKNFLAVKIPMAFWIKLVLIIFIALIVVFLIILLILKKRRLRKSIGITKRKCPVCKRMMKDDWDECIFCKYIPAKKKRKWFGRK